MFIVKNVASEPKIKPIAIGLNAQKGKLRKGSTQRGFETNSCIVFNAFALSKKLQKRTYSLEATETESEENSRTLTILLSICISRWPII